MAIILIIEDHQVLRENVAEMLALEGYQVLQAGDGKQGVELATRELPDLIVTDYHMPDMEGDEVVKILHQQAATAAIPILLITAHSSQRELKTRFDLSPDNILIKPFTLAELLERIQLILN